MEIEKDVMKKERSSLAVYLPNFNKMEFGDSIVVKVVNPTTNMRIKMSQLLRREGLDLKKMNIRMHVSEKHNAIMFYKIE